MPLHRSVTCSHCETCLDSIVRVRRGINDRACRYVCCNGGRHWFDGFPLIDLTEIRTLDLERLRGVSETMV